MIVVKDEKKLSKDEAWNIIVSLVEDAGWDAYKWSQIDTSKKYFASMSTITHDQMDLIDEELWDDYQYVVSSTPLECFRVLLE